MDGHYTKAHGGDRPSGETDRLKDDRSLLGKMQRERAMLSAQRRRPGQLSLARVGFDSDGALGDPPPTQVDEFILEATNPDGEAADWFCDKWWTLVLDVWVDHPLTVRLLPTPDALLHPVVVHHLEMLRRIAPVWRLVGMAYLSDVQADRDAERVVSSPYHEIRFIDASRNKLPITDVRWRIEQLFGRIRRQQQLCAATRPALIRLSAEAGRREMSAGIAEQQENS